MDLKGFAVSPKMDCPHLLDNSGKDLIEFLTKVNDKHFSQFQCVDCLDKSENWICLICKSIECSRYVNSHMVEHNATTKHPISLSFSDASFWCYECDSYIDSLSLRDARKALSDAKFAMPKGAEVNADQTNKDDDGQDLIDKLDNLKLKEHQPFTLEELVNGLKNNKFKSVVFLTGAGLSVASGIPDFRSPDTGLYSKLKDYNLPMPEAVFHIEYFKKKPEAFTKLAKQYLSGNFEPTLGHKFIKKCQDQNILHTNLTQNIDDLQVKAGVSQEKLIQAHGHSRKAHCVACQKQADIEQWKKCIEKQTVMRCECQGLVKPDIVFFGEQLPVNFHKAPKIMEEADLVFIMGTSLAVMPFAFLAQMIELKTPVVLLNMTDSLPQRSDKLWLKGDIQEEVKNIIDKVGWKL